MRTLIIIVIVAVFEFYLLWHLNFRGEGLNGFDWPGKMWPAEQWEEGL